MLGPCKKGVFNWLVVSSPLKNIEVSWDYYSQLNGKNKSHVPNHQPWFRVMGLSWFVMLCTLLHAKLLDPSKICLLHNPALRIWLCGWEPSLLVITGYVKRRGLLRHLKN